MQISRKEKETIIVFNEAEELAELETYNKGLQKKLDKLCNERPDLFQVIEYDILNGFKRYKFSKDRLSINKPKRISEKTKQKLMENLGLSKK